MNDDNILVSIQCLVYNQEPYLRQCLDGFVMQKTNFRFEAIVHDDVSTDGSAAIIREYADKYPDIIKPIYETENQYSKHDGSLRRIVNSACKGKYIAFCEGDDYWTNPLKLQKQVDFLEANPDYGMVYGKVRVYNQTENKYEKRVFGELSNGYEDLMTKGNAVPTLTVVCRSLLLKNFSDEITKRWKMGDYPLWLYISLKSKIHFMNDFFGVYRKLLHSASSRDNYEAVKSFFKSAKDCKDFFNDRYGSGLKNEIEDRFKKRMFLCAFTYKKWDEALKWYKLGFEKNYKDRIRCFFVRYRFLHKIGSYFIDKQIM